MRLEFLSIAVTLCTLIQLNGNMIRETDVNKWADIIGEQIGEMFSDATKENEIIDMYRNYAEAEIFDARTELKRIKALIEQYLKRRTKIAWDAKISLESRKIPNSSDDEVNNPNSRNFIRYISAKTGTDAAEVHAFNHIGPLIEVNSTHALNFTPNANFYGIMTNSASSTVHVPIPVYDRNPSVLQVIDWSNIDVLYRANREATRDLAFQMFCSESGFMRYFPSTSWVWENKEEQLDLFDCRSTSWYINGATPSKNVVIMVDMSGSMLGQRFEIAKQTVEAILETLSENDFINIMPFSKNARFLDDCSENCTFFQATVRNKKMLRARLNFVSSEGKAEYEKGLTKAFESLLMIQNQTIKHERLGCEDVIMLITDGAPGYYKEIFHLYNRNKMVRFFSFLIGEEAKDVDQVKWMACSNKGYMVHIHNLADVQEKVQEYVKVMSRPIGKRAANVKQENAIWSGVYKDRLSSSLLPIVKKRRQKNLDKRKELLATAVSFPVALNSKFMGVAAVSIPITELYRLSMPFNLGSRSYMFLIDNNGYVMFHPQLRQLEKNSEDYKPNYNNIGILELEVPQNQEIIWFTPPSITSSACKSGIFDPYCIRIKRWQIRKAILDCSNKDTNEMDILYASPNLDRVYRQKNKYISECIDGSLLTIGMAIAKDDEKRLKPLKPFDYGSVQMSQFEGSNWRMHPKWRYCILNDTDWSISAEEAFKSYAETIRRNGQLPSLCRPRKQLVDRFLFDLQLTSGLSSLWDIQAASNEQREIDLIFFATPSGLNKFWEQIPKGYAKSDPSWINSRSQQTKYAEDYFQSSYQQFITKLYPRSSDEAYYQRAVRVRNRIVVDINTQTNLWRKSESLSSYNHPENISILMTATKALYMDNVLVGVVGIEFTLDAFANTLKKIGCGPQDKRNLCFLLDEHAYVVYASLNTVRHQNLFSTDESVQRSNMLGRWFGHINRVTEQTMSLLLKHNFYTETLYIDYQAMCSTENVQYEAASAVRPLKTFIQLLLLMASRFWLLLREFVTLRILESFASPISAYTSFFSNSGSSYACEKASKFFLANWGEEGWSGEPFQHIISLTPENFLERPCKGNPGKCALHIYAKWVKGTNLLLVGISLAKTPSSICYDDNECSMQKPQSLQFTFAQVGNASGAQMMLSMDPSDPLSTDVSEQRCRHAQAKTRKSPGVCAHYDDDESEFSCSNVACGTSFVFITLFILLRYTSLRLFDV